MSHQTISVLLVTLLMLLLLAASHCSNVSVNRQSDTDHGSCGYQLVETLPSVALAGQDLPFATISTFQSWMTLVARATNKIQISTFHATPMISDFEQTIISQSEDPGLASRAKRGQLFIEALESAIRDRKVQVELIYGAEFSDRDTLNRLSEAGAKVTKLDVRKLMGSGVHHTKFIIADERDFYIGSSNLDWKALTEIKELGVMFQDCPVLATDIAKVFASYSYAAKIQNSANPISKQNFETHINMTNPLDLQMDGRNFNVFIGSSHGPWEDQGRSSELDAILNVIDSARKEIMISVMDFNSCSSFNKLYWPVLENAIKKAYFERGVDVKILVTSSDSKGRNAYRFFASLEAFGQRAGSKAIEVRYYELPPLKPKIPYTSLKHDKYVVSESAVVVDTSNFEAGYFTAATGVGILFKTTDLNHESMTIVNKMKSFFMRDWNSPYSIPFNRIYDYQKSKSNYKPAKIGV